MTEQMEVQPVKRSCNILDEKKGLFKEFTFPLAVSGSDPDHEGQMRTQIKYPTLSFKIPANPRQVRRAIFKFMNIRFNEKMSRKQVYDVYRLGVEHMYNVRAQAQAMIDSWGDNTKGVASRAQALADNLYEAGITKDSI